MRYCCAKASPISKEGYGWVCERCGTLLDESGLEPRLKGTPLVTAEPLKNLSRNDLCRCGSGKKFKHCCLRVIQNIKAEQRRSANRVRAAVEAAANS